MLGRGVKEMDLTEKMAFFEAYGAIAGAAALKALSGILLPRGLLKLKEPPETRACAAMALGKIRIPRGAGAAAEGARGQGPRGAERRQPGAPGERPVSAARRLGTRGRRKASSARAAARCCSRSTPRFAASSSIRSRTPRSRRRWTTWRPRRARSSRWRATSSSAWPATSSSSTPPGSGSSSTTTPPSATSWPCSAPSTSARSGSTRTAEPARVADPPEPAAQPSERGQPEERFEELFERLDAGQVTGLEIEHATQHDPRRASRPRRPPSGSTPRGGGHQGRDHRRPAGPRDQRQEGEARGAADRGPGAQQRDLGGRAHHHPRLRRVHLHPLGQRLHLLRGAGQEARLPQAPALRSRHDRAAARRRQGAGAGHHSEQDRPAWTSRSGGSCRPIPGSARSPCSACGRTRRRPTGRSWWPTSTT